MFIPLVSITEREIEYAASSKVPHGKLVTIITCDCSMCTLTIKLIFLQIKMTWWTLGLHPGNSDSAKEKIYSQIVLNIYDRLNSKIIHASRQRAWPLEIEIPGSSIRCVHWPLFSPPVALEQLFISCYFFLV